MEEMNLLLSVLMQARNVAHKLHWRTRSFAQHMALGDLYEELAEFSDELAELYMGLAGEQVNPDIALRSTFNEEDAVVFVGQLILALQDMKSQLPQEGALINKFEELVTAVAKAKYKLEQLK